MIRKTVRFFFPIVIFTLACMGVLIAASPEDDSLRALCTAFTCSPETESSWPLSWRLFMKMQGVVGAAAMAGALVAALASLIMLVFRSRKLLALQFLACSLLLFGSFFIFRSQLWCPGVDICGPVHMR